MQGYALVREPAGGLNDQGVGATVDGAVEPAVAVRVGVAAGAVAHRSALQWWETWAACGSSLATLALIAAAADPAMDVARADAIEAIYWPWAGALHTLLDGLVDRAEDAATGQPNLLDHYRLPGEAAERLGLITAQAAGYAATACTEHRLILA